VTQIRSVETVDHHGVLLSGSRSIELPQGRHQSLGKYDFTLPEAVAQGQLRPLRNPASLEDYLGQIP